MKAVEKWIWIVVVVGVILLMVNKKSHASTVIGALSSESIGNIKALQGQAAK